MAEPKKLPEKNTRHGTVQMAEWGNKVEDAVIPAFTFVNSYTDEKGEWKETNSYKKKDLLSIAILCLNRLLEDIKERKPESKKE